MRLSVVVVNYRGRELLGACLEHLRAARARTDGGVEVLVVDNASGDGSAELVRDRFPDVRLIETDRNLGFAGGVVAGLRATSGAWVALVNNDAEVEPDALRLLVEAAENDPRIGTATGQVRFHDRPHVINTAGLIIDRLGVSFDRLAGAPADDGAAVQEIFGASACVAIYRRAMLDAIGGFDESFFAFMEDADVAWRARMDGWRCLYVPASVSYHHGSATAGEGSPLKYRLVGRNRIRLLAKNATGGQLLRWGAAMALYDLAYVLFVAVTDRTLAPARGRVEGLREWRRYRGAGRARRPVSLAKPTGPLGALRMRAAYRTRVQRPSR